MIVTESATVTESANTERMIGIAAATYRSLLLDSKIDAMVAQPKEVSPLVYMTIVIIGFLMMAAAIGAGLAGNWSY